MITQIDNVISSVVARATADIARAVRANIAEEVSRLVGTSIGTQRRTGPGRPPGSRNASPSPSSPRVAQRRRGVDPADVEVVISLIAKKPGLRTEQIQKELGGRVDAKKILAKLRDSGKVKTKGERRAMTYSAF